MEDNRSKSIAVILAGGVGVRMGLDMPKQFVTIAGRTSLEHTMQVFNSCDCIDEILVMMDPASLDRAKELLKPDDYPKLTAILPGGANRNETSYLALTQIDDPDAKVIFHDAVRPLIDAQTIAACVDALDTYSAVDTAIPSADTIIEVDDDNLLRAVPPRAALRRGQTPQAFRHRTIMDAYLLALADPNFSATDDCSVVLKYQPHVPIIVVPGSDANIKLTEPIDVHLADKLFQLKHQSVEPTPLPPEGLDGAVVVVFGGSSGIGLEVVSQLRELGATAISHSRSTTGVHVEDRKSVAKALRRAARKHGRIDHVVLTAGELTMGPLESLTDERLRRSIDVNLMAPFIVAQEARSYLAESQGSLLLYASSSYTRGRANYTVYSATKAAVVNLTQALADEWSGEHIRVNCISPSRTATPMRARAFGPEDESELATPASVAVVSLHALASSMTGQVFDVRVPSSDPLAVHFELVG